MTRVDRKIFMAKRRMQDRRLLNGIKAFLHKGAAVLALLLAAYIFTGAYNGPLQLVETTYKVQKGDTLWTIGEEYLEKNTGGKRYILEFIEDIKEINPELVESKGQVYPGQELRINYWIKAGE